MRYRLDVARCLFNCADCFNLFVGAFYTETYIRRTFVVALLLLLVLSAAIGPRFNFDEETSQFAL